MENILSLLEKETRNLHPKAYMVVMKASRKGKGKEYSLYECWEDTLEKAKLKLFECAKFYDLFREVMWCREGICLNPMLWAVDKAGQKKLIMDSNSLLPALWENRKEVDEFFETDWFTSFSYIDHYWANEIPVTEDCTVTLRIPTLEGNPLQIRWEFAWYQAEDAEAKVQELVTRLLQTNVGGEILLQEFDEYNTPFKCYAVTVTELGEVYTNFS